MLTEPGVHATTTSGYGRVTSWAEGVISQGKLLDIDSCHMNEGVGRHRNH